MSSSSFARRISRFISRFINWNSARPARRTSRQDLRLEALEARWVPSYTFHPPIWTNQHNCS